MKVGIIVVNYSKKDLLEKCLLSLRNVQYENFQVVVIDNGSTDGSQALVRKSFPLVTMIEMGYNSGFCKANNAGIKKCLSDGCEGIVLLNNDTEVDKHFLTAFVSGIDSDKKIGMVAAKILFFDRKGIVDSSGLEITPDGLSKNRGLGKKSAEYNFRKEVFCPAGAAAFYTKELLEDIEWEGQFLDELYEYYYEELDLGWRARLSGWGCLYCPEAIVYHHKSATSGAYSKFIAFYTNRNVNFNILKNYPGFYMAKAMLLSVLRYPLLLMGMIFNKGVGHKIRKTIGFFDIAAATLSGMKSLLLNIVLILKKRKFVQQKKQVKNAEINRWFSELGLPFFESIFKL